jgi:hypothetical protein
MAENTISLSIDLQVKKAIKAVEEFHKDTAKSLEGVTNSFNVMKAVALGAVTVFASGALLKGISSITDAAAESDAATVKLNQALSLSGEYSQKASDDMLDFASSLQEVTTYGDDAIVEQLALAKSFGATNEQAKELVKAATDLAAATGMSLDSAVTALGKSFSGVAGPLGELTPEIRKLTKEQLEAGDAIKIVGARFQGTAEIMSKTFAGQVERNSILLGDIGEELGKIITQNPVVVSALEELGKIFKKIGEFIAENKDAIMELTNKGFKGLLSVIPEVLRGFSYFGKGLTEVVRIAALSMSGLIDVASLLVSVFDEGLANSLDATARKTRQFGEDFSNGYDVIGAKLEETALGFERYSEKIEQIENSSNKATDTQLANISKVVSAQKKANQELSTSTFIGPEIPAGDLQTRTRDAAIETKKKADEDESKRITSLMESVTAESEKLLKIEQERVALSQGLTKSFLSGLAKGAEGARSFVVESVTQLATAFAGPIGAAFGPIFDLLTQGPEATKKAIDAFAEALPDIIKAFAEAAPVFVTALAENADEILIALADPMVWIPAIVAFSKALTVDAPRIILQTIGVAIQKALLVDLPAAFAKMFDPKMWSAIIDYVGQGIVDFFTKAFDKIKEGFNAVFQVITEFFKPFTDAISRFGDYVSALSGKSITGKAKSFGGKASDKFKDAFGFAEGGQVPSGFPNDSYPARLTSGENIITAGETARLSDFLDRNEGIDMATIQGLLVKLAAIVSQPMTVNTRAEVNGKGLADIILTLNRNNTRLA